MLGVLEFEESFDTLPPQCYVTKNLPNSACLLPLPFALHCMMVKGFPLIILCKIAKTVPHREPHTLVVVSNMRVDFSKTVRAAPI